MRYIFISLILTVLFPVYIYAQEDTSMDELIATSDVKAAEIEQLDEEEEERTQQIANLLGFVLPPYTDNPSYVITFTDPSPSKHGVEIELDGASFTKITSPYTFPALSIGSHTVKFRFQDKDDNVQLLEYELIVIPRPPIVNTPTFDESTITITGTALSNSEVVYILSANAYNSSGIVQSDENGDWEVKITPEGGVADGIYTFIAYTRKYGYASNLSTPVTFGVGDNSDLVVEKNTPTIYFAFAGLNKDNIVGTFRKYPDLIILVIGSFVLGLILAITFNKLIYSRKKNKKVKEVEDIILKKDNKPNGEKEKTLRELFEPTESKDLEVKKEIKKEASIINKDMFLKTYKRLDPDTPFGKDNNTGEKKKVKVSLTSENK